MGDDLDDSLGCWRLPRDLSWGDCHNSRLASRPCSLSTACLMSWRTLFRASSPGEPVGPRRYSLTSGPTCKSTQTESFGQNPWKLYELLVDAFTIRWSDLPHHLLVGSPDGSVLKDFRLNPGMEQGSEPCVPALDAGWNDKRSIFSFSNFLNIYAR